MHKHTHTHTLGKRVSEEEDTRRPQPLSPSHPSIDYTNTNKTKFISVKNTFQQLFTIVGFVEERIVEERIVEERIVGEHLGNRFRGGLRKRWGEQKEQLVVVQ
jgi:hypothetical protein